MNSVLIILGWQGWERERERRGDAQGGGIDKMSNIGL